MRWFYRRKAGTFLAREDGVVAVEFVILFPIFMLILVGIVEFGHLFNVRHTLTNASREGARAAVVYTTATDRKKWAEDTAKAAVDKYLADTKFGGPYTVTPVAGTATGNLVTVTVTSDSGLLLLDKVSGKVGDAFSKIKTVSAETTMRME